MRLITLQQMVTSETELMGLKPIKILTFPEARQATNFSCGASSVQAVLYYYGIDIREDKLIKIFDARPTDIVHSGIDPDILKQKLEQLWGLKVKMGTMSLEEVKSYIDKDIPVILAIQAWRNDYSKSYKDGHYVVAIGYTDKHLIFEDPSILANRGYLPFDEVEKRWHDADYHGNRFEHLGLVVYGKRPVYKPDAFKKIL